MLIISVPSIYALKKMNLTFELSIDWEKVKF